MLKAKINQFIGTWKLIECFETDSKGNISYPWGQDALGYIIYTVERIMAVQIMRKNRNLFKQDAPLHEREVFLKDYNAYFGTFEIDETNETIIHTIQGHLNPNLIGKKNVRTYKFYDNKLSLTAQNKTTQEKLLWQRLHVQMENS
jgi:hypothetical protein